MSAEARAALPATSTLPEEGIDLRAEVARYEEFLVDQALVRTLGNKAQAAQLLGLNRTTLVEMLKRRPIAPAAKAALGRDATLTLRERMDELIAETYEACGRNAAETARALGIGRSTFYRSAGRLSGNDASGLGWDSEIAPETERAPETTPSPAPLPPEAPVSEPAPAPEAEPAPEAPEPPAPAEPAAAAAASAKPESEPPTGVYPARIPRSVFAALRAEGLDDRQIAQRLGVSRYLVEKALRTPATPVKCSKARR